MNFSIKKLFLENIKYKIIALLCSLIFFYSFQGEKLATRTITTDVIAIMDPPSDEYILISPFPSQVAIKIEGSASIVKSLRGQDIGPMVVTISDFNSRTLKFDKHAIQNLPRGISVIKFYPESIPLRFEKRIEKTVSVVPVIEDSVAPGRVLVGQVKVKPEKIKIKGAESIVRKIERWDTQPISIEALKPGVHEIKVGLIPPKVAHVATEEEEVNVIVEIDYRMTTKWFKNVPISVEHQGTLKNYTLNPSTTSILLSGPEELLKPLEVEQLYFYVEVKPEELNRSQSITKNVLHGPLPEKTSIKKLYPEKVKITLKQF